LESPLVRRRHFAIVLVLLAIAVAYAAVVYTRNLGFSKRPPDKQLAYFQSDDWLDNSNLELRGMQDGSWAVFPMTTDQFLAFYSVRSPKGSVTAYTEVRSEPSSELVSTTRFLPGIYLEKSGFVVKVIDGEQLWRSSIAPRNPEGFASIPYQGMAKYEPEQILSIYTFSGYVYMGHAEHPSLPLIAVVSSAVDQPWFPWTSRKFAAPLVVEFFSTLSKERIGKSHELVRSTDGYLRGFQRVRGWTPDGQWLLMTSAGKAGGIDAFSRIWAVSLQMAELEGFAAEHSR
jgi:hypothetical protein